MKKIIILLSVSFTLFSCSNSNQPQQPTVVDKQDTIPTQKNMVEVLSKEAFAKRFREQPILWNDFIEDTAEFRPIKNAILAFPAARRPKVPIAARYDIAELMAWLNILQTNSIDSVDLFFAKYPAGTHHTSTSPIAVNHRNGLTIILAGKNTSPTTTPLIPPFNVGNPWP